MNTSKDYFEPLTGIRAIAAFLVFFHHYGITGSIFGHFVDRTLHQGYVGVSMFFVLSGFLISFRYRDVNLFEFKGIKHYFYNRAIRILPLYWVVCVGFLYFSNEANPLVWFLCLTLTQGFFREFHFSGIPQAWSLTVEENFYMFAPLILFIHRRLPLALVLIGVYLLGWALFYSGGLLKWHGFFETFRLFSIYSFYGRVFEFLLGVWLSRLYVEVGRNKETTGSRFTYLGLALCGLAIYGLSLYPGEGLFLPIGLIVHNFLFPVAVVVLYWGLINEKSPVASFLGHPIMSLLGKSSYAFYLIHWGTLGWKVNGWIQNSLLLFVVLNIIAVGCYLLIEHPIHKFFKSRASVLVG